MLFYPPTVADRGAFTLVQSSVPRFYFGVRLKPRLPWYRLFSLAILAVPFVCPKGTKMPIRAAALMYPALGARLQPWCSIDFLYRKSTNRIDSPNRYERIADRRLAVGSVSCPWRIDSARKQ